MNAVEMISELFKRYNVKNEVELARVSGIPASTIRSWRKRKSSLTPDLVFRAFEKARNHAIFLSLYQAILPIIEYFPLSPYQPRNSNRHIFDSKKNEFLKGLRKELEETHGIYVFFNSHGKILYCGKAKDTYLWSEINSAFNRRRKSQTRYGVEYSLKRKFVPAYKKDIRLTKRNFQLHDLASYLSVYKCPRSIIDKLEAFLIRTTANDNTNDRMETF